MSSVATAPIREAVLAEGLTPSDRAYIASIHAPKRKNEIATWRSLLRRELIKCGASAAESDILYNEVGAPYLANSDIHISISHSATHVAVMIDSQRCGVDIESYQRNFTTAASRFTNEAEQALLRGVVEEHLTLPTIWSAKEAAFKYSGLSTLELMSDIVVCGATRESITCQIRGGEQITLQHRTIEGNILVSTTNA